MSINGGIASLDEALDHLAAGMDGVMVGRAAYQTPSDILLDADRRIFGRDTAPKSAEDVVLDMLPYIDSHLVAGGRLNQVTRHMLGLFTGSPGARGWKRVLSENSHREGAGTALVQRALAEVVARAA